MTYSIAQKDVESAVKGKRVMVTGAGGSIGSEICKLVATGNPESITLVSHSELALFTVEQSLPADIQSHRVLADIRSYSRLASICNQYKPEIVFHAAAIKHVVLAEENISETVLTNVLGTANVVGACIAAKVKRLVVISTDKAVKPISVMGATKRAAELYCALPWKIDINIVRFGNVVGSSGSVVPIFQSCIDADRNLTVTDKAVTRYFMEIPEAAALVVQTVNMKPGLFVLDMGKPLSIYSLAEKMISESGKDLAIEICGLRPGEKVEEELFYSEENPVESEKEGILRGEPMMPESANFLEQVHALGGAVEDTGLTMELLKRVVTDYVREENEIH